LKKTNNQKELIDIFKDKLSAASSERHDEHMNLIDKFLNSEKIKKAFKLRRR